MMNRRSAFIFSLPVYACLLILIVFPADAYVLKGEHIIQLMIAENNLPTGLSIEQQVTFSDPGIESVDRAYDQQVRYRIPGEFRSDIDGPDLHRIHVVSSAHSLTVLDGRVVAESETWVEHYKDIFFYRSRHQMVEKLESLGINFSVISLGRYNGVICYILGAEYGDESIPQLWIAKDTFQPVRWIFEVSDEQGVVETKEILYEDWKTHYKFRYPSKIEFYQGTYRIRSISVLQAKINPPFSEDLFDINQLKKFYSHEIPENPDLTKQNEIEKRIENFKQIYE